jgi:hypothetical protein
VSQTTLLEKVIRDSMEGVTPPLALPRWALIGYVSSRRRVFAVLFDTKEQAIENMDDDEVLVKVRVSIERLYR